MLHGSETWANVAPHPGAGYGNGRKEMIKHNLHVILIRMFEANLFEDAAAVYKYVLDNCINRAPNINLSHTIREEKIVKSRFESENRASYISKFWEEWKICPQKFKNEFEHMLIHEVADGIKSTLIYILNNLEPLTNPSSNRGIGPRLPIALTDENSLLKRSKYSTMDNIPIQLLEAIKFVFKAFTISLDSMSDYAKDVLKYIQGRDLGICPQRSFDTMPTISNPNNACFLLAPLYALVRLLPPTLYFLCYIDCKFLGFQVERQMKC